MTTRNPCVANDCHACCVGTQMTLTEADARRLEVAGHQDFFFVNDNHDLQLVNVNGHCIFLVEGRCSVYDDRPDGCRIYPLILDRSVNRVILDSECPWALEFTFTRDDEVLLRNSVIDEDLEARLRREGTGRRSPRRTGTTGRS